MSNGRQQGYSYYQDGRSGVPPQKEFTGSWPFLILLILLLWPAALIYFFIRYQYVPVGTPSQPSYRQSKPAGAKQVRPAESRIKKWSDPDSDDGCEAFGEFDEEDEDCVECKKSTPSMAKWCRKFSKEPSTGKKNEWKNEEDGCEAFGEEYDPTDEDCKGCCSDTPTMWFWCRKYSTGEERTFSEALFR